VELIVVVRRGRGFVPPTRLVVPSIVNRKPTTSRGVSCVPTNTVIASVEVPNTATSPLPGRLPPSLLVVAPPRKYQLGSEPVSWPPQGIWPQSLSKEARAWPRSWFCPLATKVGNKARAANIVAG